MRAAFCCSCMVENKSYRIMPVESKELYGIDQWYHIISAYVSMQEPLLLVSDSRVSNVKMVVDVS